MCGIAGIYLTVPNVKPNRWRDAIRPLAREMEKRGPQSWGAMDNKTVVHGLGKITDSLRLPSYAPQAFALHTRYATTGKIKESNSHPFTVYGTNNDSSKVVGMHNGMITNHSTLNKIYGRTCRVDSQHIFAHVADGLPFDDLEGYGTIVYLKDGEWYIGTFNGGELCVMETRIGYIFASTREAVYQALDTGNLWNGARHLKLEDDAVYKITPSGLELSYHIKVQETKYTWQDSILFDWKGTLGEKTLHYGDEFWCEHCGGSLGTQPEEFCGYCGMPTMAEADDYEFETMPKDMRIRCMNCLEWIEEGQEFVQSDCESVCLSCFMGTDFNTEELEERHGAIQ